MCQSISLSRGSIAGQREDRALSHEVHGGGVLVQVCEDRSERLARMQLLRGRRVLGIHVYHKVGVCRKERHLTLRIPAIGAMGVGLDQFPDSEPIRRFSGGKGDMLAHGAPLPAEVAW